MCRLRIAGMRIVRSAGAVFGVHSSNAMVCRSPLAVASGVACKAAGQGVWPAL